MAADTRMILTQPTEGHTGLPSDVQEWLRCPRCGADLRTRDEAMQCINPACDARYPILHGIPILINEAN
jgi:uncharacterized protein YbaR (Trm112 family)